MVDPATLIPAAHAGHWILYLAPLVIVLVAVLLAALRERSIRDEEGGEEESAGS